LPLPQLPLGTALIFPACENRHSNHAFRPGHTVPTGNDWIHKKTDSAFVCLLATATTGVVGFRPSPRPRYVAGIVRSYSTAKLCRWALTTSPISTVCTPVFAHADAAETWFADNDPEGVAFEYEVIGAE
jgi:hypothetical protein